MARAQAQSGVFRPDVSKAKKQFGSRTEYRYRRISFLLSKGPRHRNRHDYETGGVWFEAKTFYHLSRLC